MSHEHRDPTVHAAEERRRYWLRVHGAEPPVEKVIGRPRPHRSRTSFGPVADVPSGHPLYDEAQRILLGFERNELGGPFDYSARDLLQDFVLAALEGRDPVLAIQSSRRAGYQRRRMCIYGLDLTTDLAR